MTKIKIGEIEVNDVFSEISHLRVKEVTPNSIKFHHIEGNNEVEFSHGYVENLLQCAEQYHKEVKVGMLDKYWTAKQLLDAKNTTNRVGDLRLEGIRTIFENVRSSDVFTVCFRKADVKLNKSAYEAKVAEVIDTAITAIEKARTSKKSVSDAAKEQLQSIVTNPVLDYVQGEERVLRGYKVQFTSNDGRYDCFDMDINAVRPVNINSILYFVYQGVKYIVE